MECDYSSNGYEVAAVYSSSVHIILLAALAVYTRSPAAYEDLKSFKLLQANREDAGECMDLLENEGRHTWQWLRRRGIL